MREKQQKQAPSLSTWSENMLAEISDCRAMLDYWLDYLKNLAVAEDEVSPQQQQSMCECTRMILVAGETLHGHVKIFMTWSDQPAPDCAWSAELVDEAIDTLSRAATKAAGSPYSENIKQRLTYICSKRHEWSSHSSKEGKAC